MAPIDPRPAHAPWAGPPKVSNEEVQRQIREKLATARDPIDVLREGADASLAVDRWVRVVAAEEAEHGGSWDAALRMRGDVGWTPLMREVYGDLYDQTCSELPAEERGEVGSWVHEALRSARELPEWQGLRSRCQGDAFLAGLGTHTVAEVLKDHAAQGPQEDPELLDLIAGATGDPAQAQAAKNARAALASAVADMKGQAAKNRSAMRKAIATASEAVDAAKSAASALTGGLGALAPTQATHDLRALAERIAKNPQLREIAKLAGRLRQHARAVRRTKTNHAPEEVVETMIGSDISRLAPNELAALADPDLELGLMQRLHEGAAGIYRLRGNEKTARGPVIFVLDESGSMHNEPDAWAKAAALVMAEIALAEKRDFVLVHFGGYVSRVDTFRARQRVGGNELADALLHFANGGTNTSDALDRAALAIRTDKTMKKADVVLLTDGQPDSIARTVEAMLRLKDTGARIHGIAVDMDYAEAMRMHCDTYVRLNVGDDSGLDDILAI